MRYEYVLMIPGIKRSSDHKKIKIPLIKFTKNAAPKLRNPLNRFSTRASLARITCNASTVYPSASGPVIKNSATPPTYTYESAAQAPKIRLCTNVASAAVPHFPRSFSQACLL